MKPAALIVAPLLTLLTLAPAHVSAGAARTPQTVTEKVKDGAAKTKDAVKDGLSKTGEVMTDAWITTRVHARFVDEDLLKDSDISVDTSKHVVTLTGTVMGRAGRARATSVAKGTEGVHRVVNRLTIGPKRKG